MSKRLAKRKIMYELIEKIEKGDKDAIKKIDKLMDDEKHTRNINQIVMFFPDKKTKTFKSINECAKNAKLSRETVKKHLKRGTMTKTGFRFEYEDEYESENEDNE